DPLQRLLQRPPCCRQGTRREEALDVVALLGGAERREIVDQRDVAERDRDLRLELGPVLLDVRPRGLRGILGEKRREVQRRVLAAQLRRQRVVERPPYERRIAERRQRIQVAVVLVGALRRLRRIHQRVEELRVAVRSREVDQRRGENRIER